MRCRVKKEKNNIIVEFAPILNNKNTEYKIDERNNKSPSMWYTFTHKMVDFIGNIISIKNNKCVVKGVYSGKMQKVKNIRIIDLTIKRIGERVMITEHVDLTGKLELIATKRRILHGDLNFINVGYLSYYAMIDVYTGEFKMVEVK